jgi:transposase
MEANLQGSCVGIDVAKHHWDVAVAGQRRVLRFVADASGLVALMAYLEDLSPRLVCLEATGGYERSLRDALHQRSIRLSVVNPRQVRDFARAQGELAKTDAIDAGMIARFAAAFNPKPDEQPSAAQERLRALRARRQQVVHSLTQEKNRLATAPDVESRGSIQEAIDFYDRQLRELDRRIAEMMSTDPVFRQRLALLTSVPGVGAVTAAGLLAELPELGTTNRGQAAKLVGLAPINRDSGSLRGKRMIGDGRTQVRRSLYMATIVATQHNQLIRNHYRQLLARGKTKMTALVACAKATAHPQRHHQKQFTLEKHTRLLKSKTVATSFAPRRELSAALLQRRAFWRASLCRLCAFS